MGTILQRYGARNVAQRRRSKCNRKINRSHHWHTPCHSLHTEEDWYVTTLFSRKSLFLVLSFYVLSNASLCSVETITMSFSLCPGFDHVVQITNQILLVSNAIFRHIQQHLSDVLKFMSTERKLSSVALLTRDFHVWPDFHGNRSPVADPTLKGMVCILLIILYVNYFIGNIF